MMMTKPTTRDGSDKALNTEHSKPEQTHHFRREKKTNPKKHVHQRENCTRNTRKKNGTAKWSERAANKRTKSERMEKQTNLE